MVDDVGRARDRVAVRAHPGVAEQFDQVTQFIANERLCCPFFSFVLEVTPARGLIWLRITGRAGVKDFLQAELGQCGC